MMHMNVYLLLLKKSENSLDGDVVTLVGGNRIIMKSYFGDCFSRRIVSSACSIACLVGTNAINCWINSRSLYYIILKGFPFSVTELFQLLSLLHRKKQRKHQDTTEIVIYLLSFHIVYYSILITENKREQGCLFIELRTVSQIIFTPRMCIQQKFFKYYGH